MAPTDYLAQEDIERAAREANAHDFISEFKLGYNTLVGDKGIQLSGGQVCFCDVVVNGGLFGFFPFLVFFAVFACEKSLTEFAAPAHCYCSCPAAWQRHQAPAPGRGYVRTRLAERTPRASSP